MLYVICCLFKLFLLCILGYGVAENIFYFIMCIKQVIKIFNYYKVVVSKLIIIEQPISTVPFTLIVLSCVLLLIIPKAGKHHEGYGFHKGST